MEDSVQGTNTPVYPSLYRMRCPECDAQDYKVLGTKGALAKGVALSAAFGAVGNLVASAMSEGNASLQEVKYRCNDCKKKFQAMPMVAEPDEILSQPCKVTFLRQKAFTGMAVAQTLWLNGTKVATVKNGKTIDFVTNTKHNVLFVTDHTGVAFKGHYDFEAQPGGHVEVNFKRKFK